MEETIKKALNKGVEMHVAGQFSHASQLYESVIQLQPEHADANHNMGLLKLDIGHDADALPYLQTALQADTNVAQFWLSYIKALIKLDRLDEAARILNLAKESGIEGKEFLELSQLVNSTSDNSGIGETDIVPPSQLEPNTLGRLKLNQALRLAEKMATEGEEDEAKRIYKDIVAKFPKNKRAQQALSSLGKPKQTDANQNPPQDVIKNLINLYNQGQFSAAVEKAQTLAQQYPDAFMVWNVLGAAQKGLGRVFEASKAFKKVTVINPNHADGFNNLGVTFHEQGKPGEAIEAYNKALSLKPDNAEAFNNKGNSLQEQGKLKEAIEAFDKAVSLKPDYAEAYNNKGTALKEQGKLQEAIEAFDKALSLQPSFTQAYNNKGIALKDQGKLKAAMKAFYEALSLKPDFTEVYINMGIALQDQGKLDEAIEAYNRALTIEPHSVEAHRNLSTLIKYEHNHPQIFTVDKLLKQSNLKDNDRCSLNYAYAKMMEDTGNFDLAFSNYVAGGKLKQKLLSYDREHDEFLFGQIEKNAPNIKSLPFEEPIKPGSQTPIFILGMLRSGTTLVEQIISSHSQVLGAGELPILNRLARPLFHSNHIISSENLVQLRKSYLNELRKVSGDNPFVTDKMPQNFLYIGLILKSLPEAKVVHVKRNPAATCWSNFKHYFSAKGLGYSYNLDDTTHYFIMYQRLMKFWEQHYAGKIYHLDYDLLTIEQEKETKRLIAHLGLPWEEACLSPEKNGRSVRTASQLQVRKKLYKNSSQAWRKYENFLNDVFDRLEV